ncbi:MAG: formate C-acetyltransferase/glycerol dehydratase family glycyl radical enzyme [Oligoflexia bacterium]|nr:formate C-acetyltransferase/glycerol dehydratase family glycyl radical enzyme [Oligoflexia bacterium]
MSTSSVLPERIQKIREKFFTTKPSISIYRAKAFTEVASQNPGMPIMLMRAKAIYRTAEILPIYIDEGELIIGHPGGKSRAGVFSPDVCWRWVEKELDTVHQRVQDPYEISSEDKKTLREEIFPFWKGRSVDEKINAEMAAIGILPITYDSGVVDCEVKTGSGGGDLSPGFGNILFHKGYAGIKRSAEENLKNYSMSCASDIDCIYFLQAVVMVCDAMILLGKRYSALAQACAERESNPKRKGELLALAEICAHIPAYPPRSFHEALQMIWFGQISIYLEENTSGTSPGRVDQYVYPYLKSDLESKRVTQEEARELLYCFLMKFNEIPWPLSEAGAYYFAGYIPFFNLVVGGQTTQGKDATNDLSYMILECVKTLKMYQPSLAARIHNNTPQAFLIEITDVVSKGLGFPALHFDDPTIKMLLSRGISLEDARDYCLMGCVEPYVHGKLFRWTSAVYTNFPVAIEFALTNGVLRSTGKSLGKATGALSSFKNFLEFEVAVKKQLDHIIEVSAIATLVSQRAHRDILPKPMSSAIVEGCVESARDIMQGGAKYNSGPGMVFVGLADYANSMAAIKRIVFEEQRFSLTELSTALAANFEGYPEIERACLAALKYGNDHDEVDLLAADVLDYVSKRANQYRGLYANMELGTLSVTTNIPQGKVVSALPSGRRAGMPLADGIGPAQGTDISGPTAAIKSVDKLNHESTSVGTLFNMKLHPNLLKSDRGKANFMALVRAHNQLGGSQIQFNCISREELLDAQANPQKYRSLIVRVSGYSAFFTELCKEVQDDIISRTEQKQW